MPDLKTFSASDIRIEYRGVGKRFENRHASGNHDDYVVAVKDVDLAVRDGEVVSLIGPSGCGKSTLLNMGSGLYQPSAGEVFVDQEKVDKPNSHVGFMLQKDLLLPWRTIRKNVEFGLEIQGVPAKEHPRRSWSMATERRSPRVHAKSLRSVRYRFRTSSTPFLTYNEKGSFFGSKNTADGSFVLENAPSGANNYC